DEIVALEQNLVDEGMPIEEIQSLCDIHAAVFDGSISDIHRREELVDTVGHPANVLKVENDKIHELIEEEIKIYLYKEDGTSYLMLRLGIERLMQIDKHYARKENLFFPGLEKRGITSIPKVMWGVDDEIRSMLKKIKSLLDEKGRDIKAISKLIELAIVKIEDMIIKENNILLPKLAETLNMNDWVKADMGSDEIGYFLEKPKKTWIDKKQKIEIKENAVEGEVYFDAGSLSGLELNSILNTLPLDMTFVDKDGNVKYFTKGKERIFPRTLSVIGRHVSMCHPPKSVHIVEAIVESFRNGEKDNEDFYINMGGMFVYIRYYAVRDKESNYLGTIEVTQNIKPIRDLEGEKRLMSK
ncbi:MAG: DUF438 domain-containing protein, partial [Tenericutes bacterium]|nr:DUF438 domain-containing protein [Mycoplasmatota bacterium]